MTNEQLLIYSCKSHWLGLFKKVYKTVNSEVEDVLKYYCLWGNSYLCAKYILDNYKISWDTHYNWFWHDTTDIQLLNLCIDKGCNLDNEIADRTINVYQKLVERLIAIKEARCVDNP